MKIHWKNEIEALKGLGALGIPMARIADRYGVTKQRIKQVVDKYIPDWSENYGMAVNRKAREDARYAKWGVRVDSELYSTQRAKFRQKKANRKDWDWTVTFGELTWPTHCPILGMEIDYFAEITQENSCSFDRIDSTKGYITGNVQIISWRANRIKNDGTAAEHELIAQYLRSLDTKTPQAAEGELHERSE